ncbi:MAG TPA: hypothetical protein VFP61_06795, partial [Acidimicrobiales bacterium]|nr:hypothetical protein [Acidimicrobiales bacterium]
LPAINIANPLASIVIGVAVFDEHFRVGAVAVGVECVSLAVVLATAAALSLDRQESTARVQAT